LTLRKRDSIYFFVSHTLSIPEAALRLRRTYQHVFNLLLSGRLKGKRVGKHWRVDAADVRRLKHQHH
jgi:excisionase family DNA binding protein